MQQFDTTPTAAAVTNSFFGDIKAPVDGNYDMQASVVIPADTILKAVIESAQWKSATPFTAPGQQQLPDETFIQIIWQIVEQGEYFGIKQNQKLNVMDDKKKQRALQMLAAIDANCKGHIMAKGCMPQDPDLAIGLQGGSMNIKMATWGKPELCPTSQKMVEVPQGNWIGSVSRIVMGQTAAIHQATQNVLNQPITQQAAPTMGDALQTTINANTQAQLQTQTIVAQPTAEQVAAQQVLLQQQQAAALLLQQQQQAVITPVVAQPTAEQVAAANLLAQQQANALVMQQQEAAGPQFADIAIDQGGQTMNADGVTPAF